MGIPYHLLLSESPHLHRMAQKRPEAAKSTRLASPSSPGFLTSLERHMAICRSCRSTCRWSGARGHATRETSTTTASPRRRASSRNRYDESLQICQIYYTSRKMRTWSIYFLQQVMIQRLNSTGHLYSTCSEVDMEQHDGCTCGCRITEADCQSNQVQIKSLLLIKHHQGSYSHCPLKMGTKKSRIMDK